jgi:hypothetical protein
MTLLRRYEDVSSAPVTARLAICQSGAQCVRTESFPIGSEWRYDDGRAVKLRTGSFAFLKTAKTYSTQDKT